MSTTKEKILSTAHQKIDPLNFYESFLRQNVRPNGRHLRQCRSTKIRRDCISTADASSIVSIGATTIASAIKLEVAAPRSPNVKNGFFEIEVILNAMCSLNYHSLSKYEEDAVKHRASALSRSLSDILMDSQIINLENLCIESEKAVWCMLIDLICICNDGNLFDACLLAIMSALKTLKIPHTVCGSDDDIVYIDNSEPNKFYKLRLKNAYLLPLSFGILNKQMIADPSMDEESLLSDTIHIVQNEDGDIVHLHKSGQTNIGLHELQIMMELTQKRGKKLKDLIALEK